MKLKKFMKRAIELSVINMKRNHGGPFGAVVVFKGKIIGEGWNKVTSTNDPTAHAEISAIRAACHKVKNFNLNGATLFTSCEPCPMCLAAIYWARIDKIYYANTRKDAARIHFDDEDIYKEIPKKISKRKIKMKRLMGREAHKAFALWEEKADKIRY